MNILQTNTISVTSIYEHEYTFGRLMAVAIAEKLTKYGFTYTNPYSNDYHVFWNDQPVFVVSGQASTTKCAIRIAARYNKSMTATWGSTYEFGSVKSTSTAEQTVSLDIAFFTTATGAYISFTGISDVISCTCVSLDGEESAMHVKYTQGYSVPLIVLDKESTGNASTESWSWTYKTNDVSCAEPSRCFVTPRAGLVRNKLVEYTLDHVIQVESSATYTAGQVVTIDGEKYVYCRDKLFMRMN